MNKISLAVAALSAACQAYSRWTTANNKLYYNGESIVLHGFSTTCTEYLLRGIGMKCWAHYNWNDPKNIITSIN